jgi:DNA-binding FadR family transcriptional regulator
MTRLHREPMRVLIEEIVEGDLEPGDMLAREVDLVERFDVSRGVVRESIRGLEERGLISVRHGRGATVREPVDWDVFDPDVLTAMLAAPGGKRLVSEALECRSVFEPEAAGLAAERAGDADIEALASALDEMGAAASRTGHRATVERRFRDADIAFHRAVVRASGNRVLARMSEPLHRALAAAGVDAGDHARALADHERILSAIADRDRAGAHTAMAEHLEAAARRPRTRQRGR